MAHQMLDYYSFQPARVSMTNSKWQGELQSHHNLWTTAIFLSLFLHWDGVMMFNCSSSIFDGLLFSRIPGKVLSNYRAPFIELPHKAKAPLSPTYNQPMFPHLFFCLLFLNFRIFHAERKNKAGYNSSASGHRK